MNDEENENLETKFKKLWKEDPNKFAIITSLGWYGSINLKKISSLIDKPETTTLRYLKKLIEEGLIEVDAEKTASSWGKYYKLVDEVSELYRNNLEDFVKEGSEIDQRLKHLKTLSEEELRKEVIKKFQVTDDETQYNAPQAFKHFLSFVHNIESSIVNQLIDFSNEISPELKNTEELFNQYPQLMTDTMLAVRTVPIAKIKHVIKVVEAIRDFIRTITKLQKEFQEEIEKENISEEQTAIQFISVFLGGLSRHE